MNYAELVKRDFTYSFESGLLRWKSYHNGKRYGREVGCLIKDNGVHLGRLQLTWLGRTWMYSKIVWLWIYGEFPEHTVDHIDRNPGNNRVENLRDADRKTQCANRGGIFSCKPIL